MQVMFGNKAKKRFIENSDLEEQMHHVLDYSGHINGQGRFPVHHMHFGNVGAGFASCEIIAVYNVIKDLGGHVPLSELIYYAESSGYMLAGGFFGTKIYKIGNILEHFDIKYNKLSPRVFLKEAADNSFDDETIFIATMKNRREMPISALHTFELIRRRGKWYVYNRFNNSESAGIYDELSAILKNGSYTGAWLTIYEIIK